LRLVVIQQHNTRNMFRENRSDYTNWNWGGGAQTETHRALVDLKSLLLSCLWRKVGWNGFWKRRVGECRAGFIWLRADPLARLFEHSSEASVSIEGGKGLGLTERFLATDGGFCFLHLASEVCQQLSESDHTLLSYRFISYTALLLSTVDLFCSCLSCWRVWRSCRQVEPNHNE
jgi:hypothetical protein